MISAMVTDTAATELAIVDRTGVVRHATHQSAHNIATITESASVESATAVLVIQAKIVLFDLVQAIAMATVVVTRTTPVTALLAGPDLIAPFKLAPRSAPVTEFATTAHASASQGSLVCTAHCQLAHHHAQEMVFAHLCSMR